jgi:hypothetical protein
VLLGTIGELFGNRSPFSIVIYDEPWHFHAFRFWSIERGVSLFTIGMQKVKNVWDFEMNEWAFVMECDYGEI